MDTYFDRTRFALVADPVRFGITLQEYLRMLPQPIAPGRPRVIEGGRGD